MAISGAFEVKNLIEDDLNGHIVKLKTNTDVIFTIADSGSPMSFLREQTALRLQKNDKSTMFEHITPEHAARNLECCNGEFIIPEGRLIIALES